MAFANAGDEKLFIASGDWMERNVDHRVEVACPIYDPALKKQLRDVLDIVWQDNVKARVLDKDLRNPVQVRCRRRADPCPGSHLHLPQPASHGTAGKLRRPCASRNRRDKAPGTTRPVSRDPGSYARGSGVTVGAGDGTASSRELC